MTVVWDRLALFCLALPCRARYRRGRGLVTVPDGRSCQHRSLWLFCPVADGQGVARESMTSPAASCPAYVRGIRGILSGGMHPVAEEPCYLHFPTEKDTGTYPFNSHSSNISTPSTSSSPRCPPLKPHHHPHRRIPSNQLIHQRQHCIPPANHIPLRRDDGQRICGHRLRRLGHVRQIRQRALRAEPLRELGDVESDPGKVHAQRMALAKDDGEQSSACGPAAGAGVVRRKPVDEGRGRVLDHRDGAHVGDV